VQIRSEQSGDEEQLYSLTAAAFEPMNFSDGTEADALNTLRRDGNLVLSLVAVEESVIVGHIAFSPATIGVEKNGWFALGPVSVTPKRQRKGIGSALINEGLRRLNSTGAKGCVLTGDPAYYSRFGFVSDGTVTYLDTPSKYVQWHQFTDDKPGGEVQFSPGLQE
jgi:putative acetyltransferase